MSSGWRYSVQVPDFTKEERHGEEIVVYYQVDVLVQAPGTNEPAPPTTLKGAYPELFKKKELEPPSKRSLRFVNNNDRLLHERRQQLQTWLWNLLSSNEIAHSRFMKVFLQLNLAVRGATASSSVPMSLRDAREEDEQLETSSELSAPSGITNLSHAMTDTKAESVDAYRMGLRVEQRRELKHLMKIISTSLEKVSQEAQEVRGDNSQLQQENRSLEEKIASLHQIIKDGQFSKDEKHEELCVALEEKEATLKKATDCMSRLESSVKEAQRQCEAMESEMRSVKHASSIEMEKKQAEIVMLESKMQSQSVANAKLDQEMLETKQKARQDNRLLAEAVKSLRQERNTQLGTLKEQETKLREMQKWKEQQGESEKRANELVSTVEALQAELSSSQSQWEQRLQEEQERTQLQFISLKEKHIEETSALKDIVEELENALEKAQEAQKTIQEEKVVLESRLADVPIPEGGVRLVIDIKASAEDKESSEMTALEEELLIVQKENARLQEQVARVSEENTSLQQTIHQSTNRIPAPDAEVPNLEGLMLTIQQLQEQNRALQEESQPAGNKSMENFAEWVGSVYRELQACSTSTETMDGSFSVDEANAVIEKVADSNGRLQLLTVQVEDFKNTFPKDQPLLEPLLTSVTHLLSDFIQKCKEINEMKIDAFLTRPAEPPSVCSEEAAKSSPTSHLKRPSPPPPDSSNITEEGTSSGTPSVKMFLGGIGAKMTQGSQGFMSFMQRGSPPSLSPDSDPVPIVRRSEQP